MFCTKCGTELEERHLYCFHCGKPSRPGLKRPPERLTRPASGGKIAGVCAGMSQYLGLDVTLVRIVWLLALLLAGTGLLAYIVCWIVMPKEQPVGVTIVAAP
jgi:phage shock protein PspC (stress-responsive transcriptional regulator)